MLYDLAAAPPRPGSLLEPLFLLVSKRRQEAEYFQTKSMVAAVIAAAGAEGGSKMLEDAMDEYRKSLFPYLEGEKRRYDKQTKDALKHWAEKVAFKVRPLWRAKENQALISKLRRGKVKILESERKRKGKRRGR